MRVVGVPTPSQAWNRPPYWSRRLAPVAPQADGPPDSTPTRRRSALYSGEPDEPGSVTLGGSDVGCGAGTFGRIGGVGSQFACQCTPLAPEMLSSVIGTSTKVMRFSSTPGWWIEAHRPAVPDGAPGAAQVVGGGRRSQPAQNRLRAFWPGLLASSSSVKSERVPAGVLPANGLLVAASRASPASVVLGFGAGAAPLAAEPGVRQVGFS